MAQGDVIQNLENCSQKEMWQDAPQVSSGADKKRQLTEVGEEDWQAGKAF